MKNIFDFKTLLAGVLLISFCFSEKAILIAAFGTSTKAVAYYNDIDTRIRKNYSDYYISWCWTADFIVDKLHKKGITDFGHNKSPIQSVSSAYKNIKSRNIKDVFVLSLLISPGGEFNQLLETPQEGLNVVFSEPLLAGENWEDEIIKILNNKIKTKNSFNIMVAHGNDKYPEYNKELIILDQKIREKYNNSILISVEGQPGFEKGLLEAKNAKHSKINFIPVMFVAGDHVINDIMGSENDSFKNVIGKKAVCESAFGYNHDVINLYMGKLNKIIK